MKDDPFAQGLLPAGTEPPEDRLQRAYERALRSVIPPLVHKLNNLVTRAVGSIDAIGEGEEQARAVSEPLLELTRRLRLLTQFSRSRGVARGADEMIENVERVAGPAGPEKGVRLDSLLLVQGAVDTSSDLEPMLTLLVARELLLTAADEGLAPRDRRVRLRVEREGDGRARFWLSSPRSCLDTREADEACVTTLHSVGSAAGITVRQRVFGAVRTTMLSAPLEIEASSVREAPSERVLLLEPDPIDRELLAEVISEQGYRVSVAAAGAQAEEQLARRAFDLFLVNGDGLGQDSDPAARLARDSFSAAGGTIGVYGGPQVSGSNVHHYNGKLLADPFLDFVRLCLSEKNRRDRES